MSVGAHDQEVGPVIGYVVFETAADGVLAGLLHLLVNGIDAFRGELLRDLTSARRRRHRFIVCS